MDIEDIELYNMDCFHFLKEVKDSSVALVLIDPPYNISRQSNFSSGSVTGRDTDRFRISTEFGEWDKYLIDMDKLISELY